MIITKGCAQLRAIEIKDALLLKNMLNSADVERTTLGVNQPTTLEMQCQWIEQYKNDDTTMRYMIELENGATIGMIALRDIDWKNRHGSLSYKILASVEDRIKGDTFDAVYAILNYAFNELNLHRVNAEILDYNTFSLKLAHKVGFVDEGIMRKKVFKNGSYHDVIVLGLLEEEWKAKG